MTDRKTVSTITDIELTDLYDQAARAEAALREALDCIIYGNGQPRDPNDLARWRAALDGPAPAATQATEPREHCGDLKPPFSETTERTECVLRPGHTGSHADQHGTRWWWTDTEPQEQPRA